MSDNTQTPYVFKGLDLASEAVWHNQAVSPADRAQLMEQQPKCVWLTGLSGSGKSTLANALDATLHAGGAKTFLLDGDNVRHGLNKDLGMTENDRAENIRRVGEVAKLMVDAGLIVVCAFISPYQRDRQIVRSIFAPGQFIEVYLNTPLAVCEERDPKGLYKKAREGVIKHFTGIDDPYEEPRSAEVEIDTSQSNVEKGVKTILKAMS
ncbi:adenylyl-sulfate kinase [Saccharospirillum sp. MSK14-1]|uniref:adenylyl-sulfate kinase n=1 Tax=Saccharospirillum sp. MSK14-1 TaxID=1897632 RepID=UPI000D367065|nr:adenylyl-sulfate kinase [Saccharospirillum sp. MSK14-1]PTY36315.1 adenylyl-sulfate kinase [Saccharospirillum sp. MSK14-1]